MSTKYALDNTGGKKAKSSLFAGGREFFVFIKEDTSKLVFAFVLIVVNSIAGVATPYLVALGIDKYISKGDIAGLQGLMFGLIALYILTVVVGYLQGMMVGKISQRTLFRLREALFEKLQDLPIAFFNQNKAGDLMSRLNNDTDKLNQFLSESISRFIGTFFSILGIAVFAFFINFKMALVMLSMVLFIAFITKVLSPWVERQNKKSLGSVSNLSSLLQENLTNFRVIVAYSKRDYFKENLDKASKATFDASFKSDTANKVFEPIYDFAGSVALVLVLLYGFHLVSLGQLTIGVLVAFVSYTEKFYSPLRILATIFGTIQLSSAAWSRIREIFFMKNNLRMIGSDSADVLGKPNLRMELRDVSFAYEDGGDDSAESAEGATAEKKSWVLEKANLEFEAGKTYALVGPTGGGKSTLASIMAHLYDPQEGAVFLDSKNISAYSHEERARAISVILQEPILFTGTVAENILYGNKSFSHNSSKPHNSHNSHGHHGHDSHKLGGKDVHDADFTELAKLLKQKGFEDVIARFDGGLKMKISQNGAGLSLGQKQLISFMRAILREPRLLILDEATANIDTVTEAILNKTLESLPKDTTKVIIAHRLNTIKDADEIMFVNGHHVTPAGSFENAIKLIEQSKRSS